MIGAKAQLRAGGDQAVPFEIASDRPQQFSPQPGTAQGHRDAVQLFAEERKDLRGGTYYWYGYTGELSDPPEGTDLRAIYEGRISITPLHLSLTDFEARKALAGVIEAKDAKG